MESIKQGLNIESGENPDNLQEDPFEGQIKLIEEQIRDCSTNNDFDRVYELSLRRTQLINDRLVSLEKIAQKEALPVRLREEIARTKERITEIEEGTLYIKDLNDKTTSLASLRKRLEIAEDDLSIAEGSEPDHETQIIALEKKAGELVEQYGRRWEEIVNGDDQERKILFLNGRSAQMFDVSGKSPYENAKWAAECDLLQRLDANYGPREKRNILRRFINDLDNVLARTN